MDKPRDAAVDYHSDKATIFNERYGSDDSFRTRFAVWERHIASLSPVRLGVDLGCGAGNVTELLASVASDVLGVDGSKPMLQLARSRLPRGVRLLQADLNDLDGSVLRGAEVVVLSSVLEYLEDPPSLMRLIAENAAPNVIILASIPNSGSAYRKVEPFLYNVLRRPRYLKFSKSRPTCKDLEAGDLRVVSSEFLATPPLFGRAARKILSDEQAMTLQLIRLERS